MESKRLDRCLFIIAAVLAGALILKTGLQKSAGPEKTSLVFALYWEDEPDQDPFSGLIEEFEEQNPEIRILMERRPSGGTVDFSGPESAGSGEAAADIIALDGRLLISCLEQGALRSLESYVPAEDGGEWAVPLLSYMDLLFYNIEILKAAGFDRPPKSREEFLDCARAIGSLGKQYAGAAMALDPGDPRGVWRDVLSWIRAAGAPMLTDGRPDFQDRRIVNTLDFFRLLNREFLLAPGTFDAGGERRLEEFAARKIGMMIGSIKDIGMIRRKMGEGTFGITTVPGPADYAGRPVLGLSNRYAGIGALCKYPDEAWAFLSFLRENRALLASRTGAIPDLYVPEDPLYAKIWDIYEGAELVPEFPGLPRMAELEAAVREELALMFRGGAGPSETAAAIQKRWDFPE